MSTSKLFDYTTLTPADGDMVMPDQDAVIDLRLQAVWLIRRPDPTGTQSARGWVIALVPHDQDTLFRQVYTLFPQQQTPDGRVTIIVKPICTASDMALNKGFSTLVNTSNSLRGRTAITGVNFRDILELVEIGDLAHYQLQNGRGLRFWISWFLYQFSPYLREFRYPECLSQISLCQRRGTMMAGEEVPSYEIIIKGACPRDKLTAGALATWKACDLRNIYINSYDD